MANIAFYNYLRYVRQLSYSDLEIQLFTPVTVLIRISLLYLNECTHTLDQSWPPSCWVNPTTCHRATATALCLTKNCRCIQGRYLLNIHKIWQSLLTLDCQLLQLTVWILPLHKQWQAEHIRVLIMRRPIK